MDHDAMGTHVRGLMKFRERAEKAIAFYEQMQAGAKDAPTAAAEDPRLGDLESHVAELAESVTALQQKGDGQSGTEVSALGERVGQLDQRIADIDQRLQALQVSKDESFSGRLTTMLDWFDTNREGLEVLLSLDGEPDQTGTGTDVGPADQSGSAGAGGGAGGAQDGSGASVSGAGTTGPSESSAAPAAPVADLSNDPSARAEAAVAEPAAGTDKA